MQATEGEAEEETVAAAAAEGLAEADWAAAASNRCKIRTTQVRQVAMEELRGVETEAAWVAEREEKTEAAWMAETVETVAPLGMACLSPPAAL